MTFAYRELAVILRRGHAAVRLRKRPIVGAGAFWLWPDFIHFFGDAGSRSGMLRLSPRPPRVMTGTGLHHWGIARERLRAITRGLR